MMPKLLVLAIVCVALTLMFGFLTVLVFRWGAYSAIFLVGISKI